MSQIIRQLHQHNLLLYSLFLQSKFIDDKCYFCHNIYVNKNIKHCCRLHLAIYGAAEEKSTDYIGHYISDCIAVFCHAHYIIMCMAKDCNAVKTFPGITTDLTFSL